MVHTQVVERSGVLLRVDYETHPTDPITFHSIHVMDVNYRPVGPNLVPLLDSAIVLTGEAVGETQEASPFLSNLAEEIT